MLISTLAHFNFSYGNKQVIFIVINVVLLIFFTIVYTAIYYIDKETHFTYDKSYNLQTPFDIFYFATITQYTIGYGDISPRSSLCKFVVTAHIMLTYVIIGLLSFE